MTTSKSGTPENENSHQTTPPEYSSILSSKTYEYNNEPSFHLQYGQNIKSKFLSIIVFTILFFIWYGFFINDLTWLLLGIVITIMLTAFYWFRICREVLIGKDGITQRNGSRQWIWKWQDIYSITEKYTSSPSDRKPRMKRLIIIHDSGRDICFDTHMKNYIKASQFVLRSAKQNKIKIEQKEIPFFVLFYW